MNELARVRKYKKDMAFARRNIRATHDKIINQYTVDRWEKNATANELAEPLKKIKGVGNITALEIWVAVASHIAATERGYQKMEEF